MLNYRLCSLRTSLHPLGLLLSHPPKRPGQCLQVKGLEPKGPHKTAPAVGGEEISRSVRDRRAAAVSDPGDGEEERAGRGLADSGWTGSLMMVPWAE